MCNKQNKIYSRFFLISAGKFYTCLTKEGLELIELLQFLFILLELMIM